MKTSLTALSAAGRYLRNKAAAILLLFVLMFVFTALPSEQPTPFAELLYVSILIIGCVVTAPLLRLLVFPEAAEYAESRALRDDLSLLGNTRPARLIHYWFATGVSYLVTIACLASLQH